MAPAGQAKTNAKEKHPAFPQKKKRFYPQEVRPIRGGTAPTGHELSLSGIAAKRQPAANGWAVAPAGQAATNKTKQTKSLPKRKNGFTHKGYAPSGQTKINKTKKKKASTEDGRNFLKPPSPTGETEPPNISYLHFPI